MNTTELFDVAQNSNIPVILLDIPENGSMCIQSDRKYYIGMDYGVLESEADKRVHLAHELGHCATGSFYNRWAAQDIRQRHENRADKWAISRLIPRNEFDRALSIGLTSPWELSEHFGVTETFAMKAMCLYLHGNLDISL